MVNRPIRITFRTPDATSTSATHFPLFQPHQPDANAFRLIATTHFPLPTYPILCDPLCPLCFVLTAHCPLPTAHFQGASANVLNRSLAFCRSQRRSPEGLPRFRPQQHAESAWPLRRGNLRRPSELPLQFCSCRKTDTHGIPGSCCGSWSSSCCDTPHDSSWPNCSSCRRGPRAERSCRSPPSMGFISDLHGKPPQSTSKRGKLRMSDSKNWDFFCSPDARYSSHPD